MQNLINNIEVIPLSGDDLQMMAMKMGNPKTAWMTYDMLSQFPNVDSIFELNRSTGEHKFNTVFILLQILNGGEKPQVGHWLSLSFDDKLKIQYYDPYGLSIEQDLAATGESNLLPMLLSGHDVDVNTHQHQALRQNQNECGRHTVVRSIFHFMNNEQYNSLVIMPLIVSKQVSTPDVLVSLLTAFLDKSDEMVKIFFKQKVGVNIMGRNMVNKDVGIPVKSRGLGGRVV